MAMDLDKALWTKFLSRSLAEPPRDAVPSATKRKDAWDKAAIVISALSSLVVASAALLINSTIQRAQLEFSGRVSEAQVRAQNARSTTDLIQHLLSGEPARQRIALIALREAVQNNDDMVVDIIGVVASTTRDPSVSDEAAHTLSSSKSTRVAEILSIIARNRTTPERNKDSAYVASQAVAIRAAIERGTAVFYATQPGGKAFEDSSLKHGIFTYFLLDSFSAGRNITADRKLNIETLSSDIGGKTAKYTEERLGQTLTPIVESSGVKTIPLTKVILLAIGVSKYKDKTIPGLEFARDDAVAVATLFRQKYGAEVHLLLDGEVTSSKVMAILNDFKSTLRSDSTFVLYYAGHGWNADGRQYLASSDVGMPPAIPVKPLESVDNDTVKALRKAYARELFYKMPQAPLNGIDLHDVLKSVSALESRYKILFVDACSTTPLAASITKAPRATYVVGHGNVGAGPPLGIKYTLLKKENNQMVEVESDAALHFGDSVQVRVEVNAEGYLYVVHRTDKFSTVIFPSSKADENRVEPFHSYDVPKDPLVLPPVANSGANKLLVAFTRMSEDPQQTIRALLEGSGRLSSENGVIGSIELQVSRGPER